MRSCIGQAPLLLVAAGAILFNGRRILLQRRADSGKWGVHGGVLEPGETVEEALARELKEEIGVTPTRLKLYRVFSGEDMHVFCPNGDEVYSVNVVFLCDEYEGEPRPDGVEVLELRWFDADSLPEDINEPADRAILKDIGRAI